MYTRTRNQNASKQGQLIEYAPIERIEVGYSLSWTYERTPENNYIATVTVGNPITAVPPGAPPKPSGSASTVVARRTDKPWALVQELATNIEAGPSYISSLKSNTVTYSQKEDVRQISDVPVKDFKKRMAAGDIINNPVLNDKKLTLVFHEFNSQKPQGSWIVTPWHGNLYIQVAAKSGCEPLALPAFEDHTTIVVDALRAVEPKENNKGATVINKSFANLNNGALTLAVEIGERKETFAYIVTVINRVATLIEFARHGDWKAAAPKAYKKFMRKANRLATKNGTHVAFEASKLIVDFLASFWLEVRFAIRPLIIGAEQAVDAYNKGLEVKSRRFTENSMDMIPTFKTWKTESTVGGHVVNTVYSVAREDFFFAGVLADVDLSTAHIRELGFTNLAGTMWELTFLSWALDYFVNTDGFFYHLTPNLGVSPLAAWSTTKTVRNATAEVTYTKPDGTFVMKTKISLVDEHYNRIPITSPSLIHLDVDLDVSKITDLAALIRVLTRTDTFTRRQNLLNYGVIK